MKKITTILFAYLLFGNLIAQPSDCVPPNSGINATIIIDADTELSLDGAPLPIGTHIVVLFSENNQYRCGGYSTWAGDPTGLSAVGGSTGYAGFSEDEPYHFRLDLPDGTIIPSENIEVTFKSPDGLFCLNGNQFAADGISCMESLHAVRQLPYFILETDTLYFEKEMSSQNITLEGNVSWRIYALSSGNNWFSYSPASGDTSKIISVAVSENTTPSDRIARLIIEADGFTNDTVLVIQKGNISSAVNTINAKKIKVFPNPFSEFLILENLDVRPLKLLGIIDNNGKTILPVQSIVPPGNRTHLSLSNLTAGQYYIQVQNDTKEIQLITIKKL